MKYQRLGFPEACDFLNDGASFKYEIRNTNARKATCDVKTMLLLRRGLDRTRSLTGIDEVKDEKLQPSDISHQTSFDASRYNRFFERPFLNEPARKFLFDERRLDPRVVRWCRLTSWTDKQGTPWLQIPYYDRSGRLTGVQNRNLIRGALPRFRFPSGSKCGIYNLPVLNLLKPGEPLFITEGCSDCWAMLSAGHKAIAIPSATLLTQDVRSKMADGRSNSSLLTLNSSLGITFHMYPDRDAPGERLFLQLKQLLPSLVHHQLPPDCKDFSDYYLAHKTG
jgi:hypothetical protein